MAKKGTIFSNLEEFKVAVLATKELISDNIAKVRIFSDGIVDISLDEQLFEKREIAEIDKNKLKIFLNTEIPVVITASLQEKPRQMLRMMLPGNEYDRKKEIREEFDKKIEFVKEKLITQQIKQRVLLREISKNDILDELKWDISIKCHDMEKGTIDKFQFATLQFICNKGGPIPPFLIKGHVGKKIKTLTVDVRLEDLEQLIDDLNVLRNNLKQISLKE